ncbi:MAG: hydrogenase nickel incorporation protein HypA [Firmicutes bacterium]|nr:hydrogenase nickel incorporation protein HypA [Bacillota bacterium]
MHELSIIQSLADQIESSAKEHGISRVKLVHLVNGKLSGVNTAALQLSFSLFNFLPLFQYAKLVVEEREIIAWCSCCRKEQKVGDYRFVCGYCRSSQLEVLSGQELYIDYYEGD